MTALPAADPQPGDAGQPLAGPEAGPRALPSDPPAAGALPPGLAAACAAMEDPEMQGLPLERRDYVLLLVVTVLVPVLLVLIGVLA